MTRTLAFLIAVAISAPAFAEGDVSAGENIFKKCKSCHMIVADNGTEIGKGGKTGPNLYGVVGRTAGTVVDFRYGADTVKAGETGLVWDEEKIAEYVQDPREYLRNVLGDTKAKSRMTFKLKDGGADVAAFLASVASPG